MFAATIRSGEQRVLAVEGDRPDGSLDDVVVDLDATVIEEPDQSLPTRQCIADRLGELGLLADQAELGLEPWLEGIEDGAALLLPERAPLVGAMAPAFSFDRPAGSP